MEKSLPLTQMNWRVISGEHWHFAALTGVLSKTSSSSFDLLLSKRVSTKYLTCKVFVPLWPLWPPPPRAGFDQGRGSERRSRGSGGRWCWWRSPALLTERRSEPLHPSRQKSHLYHRVNQHHSFTVHGTRTTNDYNTFCVQQQQIKRIQ